MSEPSRRINRYAIAAVVCAVLWPIGVVALLLGYEARIKIGESGGTERGGALATIAIVMGWTQVAAEVLIVIFVVLQLALYLR